MNIRKDGIIALVLCLPFFIAYITLALVKHNHFLTGYDLGIVDQVLWEYSRFQPGITTVHAYAFTNTLTDHLEFIYMLLAPFYWLWSDARMILLLQAFFLSFSGIPIFLFARRKGLSSFLASALTVSYLLFFGIQNALWNDVHSIVFGASFLAYLLYFFESNNTKGVAVSSFLAIICKEDVALLTGALAVVYFLTTRRKLALYIAIGSFLYLFFVFFLYFPYLTKDGYRYLEGHGLLSDPNPLHLFNTGAKQRSIVYSLAWFGFLPLLSPLQLLPAIFDFAHYFIVGRYVGGAQDIFMHYRVALAPLLLFPTVSSLVKHKQIPQRFLSLYILFLALFLQYFLHLPLSYLTKSWFWTKPQSVDSLHAIIASLPRNASVVSQNNITPHITHRKAIFTLWPDRQDFKKDSPCDKPSCSWVRWLGDPEYMVVDTSDAWDIRHFLQPREDFVEAIHGLEKKGLIKKEKARGTAALYRILKKNL